MNTNNFLQKKLYEKPFPNLKLLEVTLYPKNPYDDSENFLKGYRHDSGLDLLAGHFDDSSEEANLAKHRISERFHTLSEIEHDTEGFIQSLNRGFLSYHNHSPGYSLIRINPDEKEADLFRNGPFFIFHHQPSGANMVETGDTYFSENNNDFDTVRFEQDSRLIMISHDVLDMADTTPDDFASEYLEKVDVSLKSKDYLVSMLEPIAEKFNEKHAEKMMPGLFVLLEFK